MDIHTLTRELQLDNSSKIVMLVADGLGGLPMQPGGLTELETAKTPNLDAMPFLHCASAISFWMLAPMSSTNLRGYTWQALALPPMRGWCW